MRFTKQGQIWVSGEYAINPRKPEGINRTIYDCTYQGRFIGDAFTLAEAKEACRHCEYLNSVSGRGA